MCQLCLDACNKYWPDLNNEERSTLLMGATSFPFASGEDTAAQLKDIAERSGCDLNKALAIVDEELEAAVAEAKKDGSWPSEDNGLGNYDREAESDLNIDGASG